MNAYVHSPAADQGGLRLLDLAAVNAICHGPAMGSVLAVRLEQLVKFNHTPGADLAQPVDHLPRQADARLKDALDLLGRGDAAVAPERRDQVLRKLAIAGALVLAAIDRIAADVDYQEARRD